MQRLTNETLLQGGKYKIVRFISAGGFGNTYEGVHTMMDTKVAIKEFFPKMFCNRDENTSHITVATQSNRELVDKLRKKFVEEAKSIFKMNHPNIVKVHDIFEENGSAYYVMDFIDGKSLGDMVKAHGVLNENEAVGYIRQVADALKYVHSLNRLHLDIKPGNIMIDKNGNAMLIDFGASKHYDMESGENTSTLMGVNTKGYAPVEQSTQSFTKFSPATDIYALGATLYKLLTGITPPDANLLLAGEETLEQLPSNISVSTRNAVSAAMSLRRADRPQSIDDFLTILNVQASSNADDEETIIEGAEDTIIKEAERKVHEENSRKEKEEERILNDSAKSSSKKTWLWSLLGVFAVVGIVIGVKSKGYSSTEVDSTQSEHNASYSNGVLNVDGVSYDMVKVEAGTFTMGATSEMKNPYYNEKPTHQVTLTKNYSIGKTEVTMSLWKAVMGNTPQYYGPNKPVVNVSWNDCQNFCHKLNKMTGQNFRLPTEAEWEFAARGGNNSNHYQYSGSNKIEDVAWYAANSGGSTHDVATKQPNELGIYDMSGNVWEWCHDIYGRYSSSSQTNPTDTNRWDYRVLRGGGRRDGAGNCRSSKRYDRYIGGFDYDLGFRIALSE